MAKRKKPNRERTETTRGRNYDSRPRSTRLTVGKTLALFRKAKSDRRTIRKTGIPVPQNRRVVQQEVRAIRSRKVRPIFSRIAPLNCAQKKAKARREYFSMRAAGRGARRKNRQNHRFTVRC
jgi:hypothetical protein